MRHCSLCVFSDYLWGIETWRRLSKHRPCNGFQTTYEELKQILIITRRPGPWFSDYLWGIETSISWMSNHPTCPVFRLPMRNWNWWLWRYHSFRSCRFQTTYEELKPPTPAYVILSVIRFQTTYEELKLPHGRKTNKEKKRFSDYLWGIETRFFFSFHFHVQTRFQTTYEELKLGGSDYDLPPIVVFRLPMRNWNFHWNHMLFKAWEVFRLPMRNWNSRPAYFTTSRAIVFRLPMRNWNEILSSQIHDPRGFQTTYEELKPRNIYLWLYHLYSFSDYLWGIETRDVPLSIALALRFSDYLWGIETNYDE